MIIKRDKIFYSACGIFALGVIIASIGYAIGTLFIVGAYLLRPTLHAFNVAGKSDDERQRQIHSRAGNAAFIAVMLAAVAILLNKIANHEFIDEMSIILCVGIGVRALAGLFMVGELRRTGVIVLIAIGIIVTLFAFASAGFTGPSLFFAGIGLVFVALGLIARKHPKIIALISVLIAIGLFIGFGLYDFSNRHMAMVIGCFVMIIVAACLMLSSRPENEISGSKWTKTIRGSVLAIGALIVLGYMTTLQIKINKADKPGTAESPDIQEVQGVSGIGYFQYHKNGKLKSCALAREDTLSGQPLPADTYVYFDKNGIFTKCFLPENTEIQGHMCIGRGYGDISTGFHSNGVLRKACLVDDEVIDGIPCRKYTFLNTFSEWGGGTYFHSNGRLYKCCLSKDFTIEGHQFEKGDCLQFDENGKLVMNNENNLY